MSTPNSTTIRSRYLDVRGAASYLSMTENAIYVAVSRRQIPYRKLGRKTVFDTVELDEFIRRLEGVDAAEAAARKLHNGTVNE